MKIAILTDTPPMLLGDQGEYCGRGWIDSFICHLARIKGIQIYVLYNSRTEKQVIQRNNVYYVPVRNSLTFSVKALNVIPRLLGFWERKNDIQKYIDIIEAISPDVIHIFGTEWIGIRLLQYPYRNILVHIQGFVSIWQSYQYVYSKGSRSELIYKSLQTIKSSLFGMSLMHQYSAMKNAGIREVSCFKERAYFAGRTSFDRQIIQDANSDSHYFHIDELLRSAFYTVDPWNSHINNDALDLVSTLSDRVYKGLDLIIEVCKILDKEITFKIVWHIAGISEQSDTWKLFRGNTRFKNIRLIAEGVVQEKSLIGLLQNCDAYVHPSRIENSPNSLCEAQILGVPVIARNTGGISSLVANGETGVLFNNMFQLIEIIESLHMQTQMFAQLGKQGRECALIRHNADKIISDTLKAYKYIIADL